MTIIQITLQQISSCTKCFAIFSVGSYDDSSVGETGKPKVPLDQERAAMAKKLLKGADPEERLTWKTPEVRLNSVV